MEPDSEYHGYNKYDKKLVAVAASGHSNITLDKANKIYGDIFSLPLQYEESKKNEFIKSSTKRRQYIYNKHGKSYF